MEPSGNIHKVSRSNPAIAAAAETASAEARAEAFRYPEWFKIERVLI